MEEEKKKSWREKWKAASSFEKLSIVLLVIGAIIYLTSFFIFESAGFGFYVFDELQSDKLSQYGDFIGGIVGSLWVLASVLLFYAALNTQKEELKTTRKELELTRQEFNQQNETLSLQRFENTFFQLLGVHHGIVENMVYITGSKTYTKRNVFKNSFTLIKKHFINGEIDPVFLRFYSGRTDTSGLIFVKENQVIIQDKYNEIYKIDIYPEVQNNFGHYFRNLYRIFKFIDTQEFYSFKDIQAYYKDDNLSYEVESHIYIFLNKLKKYEYTSMVRAQLSDYELWWLTFNCLWVEGEKFKGLVEKYTILKNHPSKNLMINLNEIGLYDEAAYEKGANPLLYDFTEYRENLLQIINEKGLEETSLRENVNLKTAKLLKRFMEDKK